MAETLNAKPVPYETIPNRIRWTRKQCDAMRDANILIGRYELIDGEIISKMGQNPPHAYVVRAIMTWLVGLFGAESVLIQATIDLSETSPGYDEPEPDAAITRDSYTQFSDRHPRPQDLLILIEVADTSLRFDLNMKAGLYARAGIADFWVIDIIGRRLIVHRRPDAAEYREVVAYSADEEVAPLARPDAPVSVCRLLPPVE